MLLNDEERKEKTKECLKKALDPKKMALAFKLSKLKTELDEKIHEDPDFQKEYEDLYCRYASKYLDSLSFTEEGES